MHYAFGGLYQADRNIATEKRPMIRIELSENLHLFSVFLFLSAFQTLYVSSLTTSYFTGPSHCRRRGRG